MKLNLKSYLGKLEILSPVSIGSGITVTKKEYVAEQKKRLVLLLPDLQKFYAFICEHNLENEYEDFILDPNQKDLKAWLTRNKIKLGANEDFVRYILVVPSISGSLNELHTFIKNGRGEVYIPGSSIKGMLRTALIVYELMHNSKLHKPSFESLVQDQYHGKPKSFLNKEVIKIETEVLHTLERHKERIEDAVNCNLSGLIVGDSDPIPLDALCIAEALELKVGFDPRNLQQRANYTQKTYANKDLGLRNLNVWREAIKAHTKVQFPLTINTSLCPYSKDDLLKAVACYAKLCSTRFLAKFKGIDLVKENDTICWLGGRTGFASKTIVNALFDEKTALKFTHEVFKKTLPPEVYKDHKHAHDLALGVSPHICRCTMSENRVVDMGRCRLKIEDLEK